MSKQCNDTGPNNAKHMKAWKCILINTSRKHLSKLNQGMGTVANLIKVHKCSPKQLLSGSTTEDIQGLSNEYQILFPLLEMLRGRCTSFSTSQAEAQQMLLCGMTWVWPPVMMSHKVLSDTGWSSHPGTGPGQLKPFWDMPASLHEDQQMSSSRRSVSAAILKDPGDLTLKSLSALKQMHLSLGSGLRNWQFSNGCPGWKQAEPNWTFRRNSA